MGGSSSRVSQVFIGFVGFCTLSFPEVSWKRDMGFPVPMFLGFLQFLVVARVEKPLKTEMLNYWWNDLQHWQKVIFKGDPFFSGSGCCLLPLHRSCLGGAAHIHSEMGYGNRRALGTCDGFQGSYNSDSPQLQIYPFWYWVFSTAGVWKPTSILIQKGRLYSTPGT